MIVKHKAGFVSVADEIMHEVIMADRNEPADCLRRQADEMRERARKLIERAALFDSAADRLG